MKIPQEYVLKQWREFPEDKRLEAFCGFCMNTMPVIPEAEGPVCFCCQSPVDESALKKASLSNS